MHANVPVVHILLIRYINKFQTIIIKIIMVMMVFVILSAMLEIGWLLITDISNPPYFIIGVDKILDVFALFFLVIIGIELLETVKMIIIESSMNVDVIILVGITAVVRKILIVDLKNTDPLFLIGMGVLIIALAGTYYLVVNSEKEFKCQLGDDEME